MSESLPEGVLDLAGLREATFSGIPLGVVGWPVRHSVSPAMHTAALATLAQTDPAFSEWHYTAFELQPSELPEAIALFRAKGFRGINVTVPHKVEVLPLLDEIDSVAEKMGAVNTLVFEDGKLIGYNSDGYGIECAVKEAFGCNLRGQSVLLLGAGGASRAAAAQCVESGVRSLIIANRTLEKAQKIVEQISDGEVQIQAATSSDAASQIESGTLVINATSLGLRAEDSLPIEVGELPEGCLLFDMIYNPAETPFLLAGRMRGYPVSNGLGMLVHQGVRSLEIWTGREVDPQVMRKACEKSLST